tara:strand:- start:1698 stop:2549 length:852 start_codon:yes stop_codon:yes gene_type:complete
MKKFFYFLILLSILSNPLGAEDTLSKQKELETKIKLLEKELEIEKLKKELAEQKKANEKSQKKDSSKQDVIQEEVKDEKVKNSNDINDLDKEIIEQVKLLGKFEEPKTYPAGFQEMFLKTGCKTWICLNKKTAKQMSIIFKRSEKYNLRNPGNQIRGMALYEIFYLNTLKKNEKKINEFLENWPNENKNADDVIRMIRLNKSREKMRNALGMDLNTPVEDALEIYWIMGSFLDLGVAKKQKISKDLKLRKKFLAEYKKTISKFNSEFKKNKDQSLYDAIEKKD